MAFNEWTNTLGTGNWQHLVIWSLGQKGGDNKAAKSRETLGEEDLASIQGENATHEKVGTGKLFLLQLSAHPGDDLHDDPGAGLLQHGDRRWVGDALQTLAVHGQQAISTFQLSILKWWEGLRNVKSVEIDSIMAILLQEPWDEKRCIITRGINNINDAWNSNTSIPSKTSRSNIITKIAKLSRWCKIN